MLEVLILVLDGLHDVADAIEGLVLISQLPLVGLENLLVALVLGVFVLAVLITLINLLLRNVNLIETVTIYLAGVLSLLGLKLDARISLHILRLVD